VSPEGALQLLDEILGMSDYENLIRWVTAEVRRDDLAADHGLAEPRSQDEQGASM
jgi:hypothetical protein